MEGIIYTIFYNGNIYTQDKAYPHCTALAVSGGVIMAMGDDEELLKMADGSTKTIDLKGMMMLPGFSDTHMHLLSYAQKSDMLDLSKAKSFDDIRRICSEDIERAERNGKWILGTRFNQDYWDVKKLPDRRDLDSISTAVPICITRACYHISVCNTKAMEIMGVAGDRQETTKENIGFLSDGTPNGVVKEDSQNLIYMSQPIATIEEIKEMIVRACRDAAAQGITELHTDDMQSVPGVSWELVMKAYQQLAEEDKLPVRIYEQCRLVDTDELKDFLSKGHMTGESHGFFRLGPLKILSDGSLGAHSAAMLEPYKNDPQNNGMLNLRDDELMDLCKMAHDSGMQIAIHCIGDRALQQVLDTFETIQKDNPRADCRHGVIHCQIMSAKQQDRFREMNILAYVQPVFIKSDMNIAEDCVGHELAASSYNWRRYEDLGVHMSGGSDCPVEAFDILPNIEYTVTRATPETDRAWFPENGLTIEEAVRMFTLEAAYASFSENLHGTLTIGKYADLTVIDRDIFAGLASDIHNAKVKLTMTGGKITYSEI